jgi:hypothetical protein
MICNHFNCNFFLQVLLKASISPFKKDKRPGFEGFCPICLAPLFLKLYKGYFADLLKDIILQLTDLRYFKNLKFIPSYHYLVFPIDNIGKILEKPNSLPNLISINL